MKKLLIIFIGIITMFTVGCGKGSVEEITFDQYEQMMENEDSFILFVGSATCSHCFEFKVTLERLIEDYNVDFKYIDVDNFDDNQKKNFKENIRFTGTPTTVFIQNGKDNSCGLMSCDKTKRIEGAQSYETVVEILKNNGYIKG